MLFDIIITTSGKVATTRSTLEAARAFRDTMEKQGAGPFVIKVRRRGGSRYL